jgi:hypothetical protein
VECVTDVFPMTCCSSTNIAYFTCCHGWRPYGDGLHVVLHVSKYLAPQATGKVPTARTVQLWQPRLCGGAGPLVYSISHV